MACHRLLAVAIVVQIGNVAVQSQPPDVDFGSYEMNERGAHLLEHHSDGARLAPGRSHGKVAQEPFIAGRYIRHSPATRKGTFEWRVGNVRIGVGLATTEAVLHSVASVSLSSTCDIPICHMDVNVDNVTGLEVVLLDSDGRKTEYRTWIPVPSRLHGAGVDVLRNERCVKSPRTTPSEWLHVSDVVYSKVRNQLVIFGPTKNPLGGLYCVWEKHPETCRAENGCTNSMQCLPERIPKTLKTSVNWHHLVTKNPGLVLQCVFRGAAGGAERLVEAEVWRDGMMSHNVAVCTPPDDVREWLLEGLPDVRGYVAGQQGGGAMRGDEFVVEGVFSFRMWYPNGTAKDLEMLGFREGSVGGLLSLQTVLLPLCRHSASHQVSTNQHRLSVCAIFRDQAMYLAEWVQYHLLLGVDHFYLYDHKSVDNPMAELLPFMEQGQVDLHSWNLPGHPQKEAQLHCTHKYGHETEWLMMMDVDEFLLPPRQAQYVLDAVASLVNKQAVVFIWQEFYGHQNYTAAPPGLVIENYLYHSSNMSHFSYRKKYMFRPSEGHVKVPCIHDVSDGEFAKFVLDPAHFRINHYTVKSRQHWENDHIKRYQPVPEAWNDVRDTEISDRYLEGLKYAMCLTFGRIYQGTNVTQLPKGASCEDHVGTTLAHGKDHMGEVEGHVGTKLAHGKVHVGEDEDHVGKDEDHVGKTTQGASRAPSIKVIDPKEGSTMLHAKLMFEVVGVEGRWEDCCLVEVFFDGSAPGRLDLVMQVASADELPVVLDRDRESLPHGPSWHNLVLRLRRSDDNNYIAETHVKFRLTGSKLVLGGDSATPARAEHEANLTTRRRGFPVAYPQVCAAFLSCKRLSLLRRSISALIKHMELYEPAVPYEIAWVDNDSGPAEVLSVYRDFEIERTALYRANYGATHGMNTLLFDLCRRSHYVITLEEDWEWDESTIDVPAVELAMRVIRQDPNVVGVIFRSDLDYKMKLSAWRQTGGTPNVEYRTRCLKEGSIGWGAWTNGAALWDRERLEREVGKQNEDWGDAAELEYSQRVGAKFCAAEMRIRPGCEESKCNAVVRHIGEDSKGNLLRSPGWEKHVGGFDEMEGEIRTIEPGSQFVQTHE